MRAFDKCPVCGGELSARSVEKILSGGGNTVSIKVNADVCAKCGEHLYSQNLAHSFDEIRRKLQHQDFSHLRLIGQSFTVEDGWLDQAIRSAG